MSLHIPDEFGFKTNQLISSPTPTYGTNDPNLLSDVASGWVFQQDTVDISGTFGGVSTFTGTMSPLVAISGTFSGVSAFAGHGDIPMPIAGTFTGGTTNTGVIGEAVAISGTFSGSSVFIGELEEAGLAGTFSGSSTFSATARASARVAWFAVNLYVDSDADRGRIAWQGLNLLIDSGVNTGRVAWEALNLVVDSGVNTAQIRWYGAEVFLEPPPQVPIDNMLQGTRLHASIGFQGNRLRRISVQGYQRR